ncbi:MAG TPA: tetratricopeptide repeat protein [Pyrinomonadaceae bacterium]|nr:tetratricopeptide repeat protein [Pyrinomonadaceae bacterium]
MSSSPQNLLPRARLLALLACLSCLPAEVAVGQSGGGIDTTGTGGNHVIQGRVFLPSGRISDGRIRVLLESTSSGTLSVMTDPNGHFRFTSLMAGSYTVVVEANEQYEAARESVFIEQQTNRVFRVATPRVATVYINLRFRRAADGETRPPGVLNAALANVPKPAVELYQKGVEAARKNENVRAADLLRMAVDAHPNFPPALYELGVAYLKLKLPEKAAEALAASLKLAPEDHGALLAYGRALLELRRPAEAEEQFRKALKKNAASPSAHLYLGMILLGRREFEEAERVLRASADAGGPEGVRAHYFLGGLYWELKQYKRAADELETYLKLAPGAPDADRVRATIKGLRAR